MCGGASFEKRGMVDCRGKAGMHLFGVLGKD